MAAFTALAIAGLALGAYGQVKNSQAQSAVGDANKAAADSQATLADYNASIADLQAQDALQRGAEQENRFRTQIRGAIGAQRSGAAGNNVDVGFGSSVDTQADTAFLGELDALTIHTNAGREAWGYAVQATDLRNRAKIARQTGIYAQAAGAANASAALIAGAGNLLTGTGSLLQTRYGYAHAGQ